MKAGLLTSPLVAPLVVSAAAAAAPKTTPSAKRIATLERA
jgi:hypothetical protein